MPYEDAKTYRFNPFDLTKVWPHSDYPLIEVGIHTLNRNPENFFARDRAGRVLAGQHRARHRHQPGQDAAWRACSPTPTRSATASAPTTTSCPVNAPGRARAQLLAGRRGASRLQAPRTRPSTRRTRSAARRRMRRAPASGSWESDGELVRAAATLHAEDDDFGQAGTLYREVYDDEAKAALPRDDRRRGRRREERRDPRARHPVLDERGCAARRLAARGTASAAPRWRRRSGRNRWLTHGRSTVRSGGVCASDAPRAVDCGQPHEHARLHRHPDSAVGRHGDAVRFALAGGQRVQRQSRRPHPPGHRVGAPQRRPHSAVPVRSDRVRFAPSGSVHLGDRAVAARSAPAHPRGSGRPRPLRPRPPRCRPDPKAGAAVR